MLIEYRITFAPERPEGDILCHNKEGVMEWFEENKFRRVCAGLRRYYTDGTYKASVLRMAWAPYNISHSEWLEYRKNKAKKEK